MQILRHGVTVKHHIENSAIFFFYVRHCNCSDKSMLRILLRAGLFGHPGVVFFLVTMWQDFNHDQQQVQNQSINQSHHINPSISALAWPLEFFVNSRPKVVVSAPLLYVL